MLYGAIDMCIQLTFIEMITTNDENTLL